MTGERIPVTIAMGEEDFEHLTSNSTHWAASVEDHTNENGTHAGWRRQVCDGRFEGCGTPLALPSLHWEFAYWLSDRGSDVILARAFLDGRGFEYEVVYDTAEPGEWVILTDYRYPAWRRDAAATS